MLYHVDGYYRFVSKAHARMINGNVASQFASHIVNQFIINSSVSSE